MRNKIMAMLLLAALLFIPIGSADADAVIGGQGHGDGIDVIYSSDIGSTEGTLYITMNDPPAEDVTISLISVSDEQGIGPLQASTRFNVTVKALVEEEYTILVKTSDTGKDVARCQMLVGPSATITFVGNGGIGTMSPVGADLGSEYTIPNSTFTAPVGKEFYVWTDMKTRDTYAPGESITIRGSMTLIATWNDATHYVRYVPGDVFAMVRWAEVHYGEEFTLPECPFFTVKDKTFKGWLINDEMYEPGDTITIKGDVDAVAQWEDGGSSGIPLIVFLIVPVIIGFVLFVLFIVLLCTRARKRT